MTYRHATLDDCPLLAELNCQLIRDEGHRNRMTLPELEQRMRGWLAGIGGDLAVVLSVVQGTPAEWADCISEQGTWWLQNVATAQAFRGRRLGEVAVGMAGEHLAELGVRDVYLDCTDVRGFLPAFYERLGF